MIAPQLQWASGVVRRTPLFSESLPDARRRGRPTLCIRILGSAPSRAGDTLAPSIDYHKLEEGLRDPQAVVAVRLEHVRLNPLAANRAEATFIPIRPSRTLDSILPKLTTARALILEEQVELLLRAVAANCTQLPFCLHAVPEGRIVLVREVAVALPLVLLLLRSG